jgi:hypothetical protein
MQSTFVVLLSVLCSWIFAQKSPNTYVNYINPQTARVHLEYLAGEELEGREAGKVGQKKAAVYLSQQFNSYGLPQVQDSYFQRFPVREFTPKNIEVSINGQSFEFIKHFLHNSNFDDVSIKGASMVFAGYGIDSENYTDFSNLDVKGKIIIIKDGEPINKKGIRKVSGTQESSNWKNRGKKIQSAIEKGVAGVIVINRSVAMYRSSYKHHFSQAKMKLQSDPFEFLIPIISIDEQLGDSLLKAGGLKKGLEKTFGKINKKGKPKSMDLPFKCDIVSNMVNNDMTSENVLGFVEGSDLKDEVLIVTAHYDHIGKEGDVIFYGADDDGSGTTALLMMAEAFSKAKEKGEGPRRSILFMPVSAEEKGLLGSRYYSENPIFPLKNTVADLNIDMIGRIDEPHTGNPDYVYIIGSNFLSTELHNINEKQNKLHTQLQLDYTFNSKDDPNNFYKRSDHYNFAKYGIPVIFYFNGVHEDYHQPSDTVDKIDFNKLSKITRLVYYTAWDIANKDKRLVVDVELK